MTTAYIAWLQDDGSAMDSSLLPPAEQVELAGFRSPERQRSFLLSRLLLRKLLRPHLPSSSLIFKRAESGRLFLEDAQGWHFSLSHSAGGIAAIACTQPCGIDIEVPRKAAFESIATRYFAEAEQATLKAATAEQRAALFFRLWTLKEASVKAMREGLAGNMARLAFDINGPTPKALATTPSLQLWQQYEAPYWLASAVKTEAAVLWEIQSLSVAQLQS